MPLVTEARGSSGLRQPRTGFDMREAAVVI